MKVPLVLVTIVSESLLKDGLVKILRRHGATGFTITESGGEGSRGVRARDWEGPNLKFECIVATESADAILADVANEYFENYAVIAWLTEVKVMRGDKFAGG